MVLGKHSPKEPEPVIELLTYRQVATKLGLSARTVYEICKRGKLRSVRLGSQVRIDPADLRKFVDSCKTPAEA